MDQQALMTVEMRATRNQTIAIDSFEKPMCTKRLLLEVCQVHDIADTVQVEVILEQSVCYVDMNKYGSSAEVQKQAVDCVLTDYLVCKTNKSPLCKYIDCFNDQ